ncbi:MarR family winged helix-turn-helix transcriptional regulator [Flavihumibacter petaseus]|uniref:Putative MarR family transcriptional regulator n=1 Tax=Flavihumibacter petaseus NBRC 106054 TaxID=1220578 RepID=A0A0E9MY22_9BACT|nr:MarR family transcriptional regulator [Flavihumibacter petaseus]GAO42341.1 putative MarR family transcriptional regulator [Flavihumibacter petaseus NBRC 106054]
MAYELLKDVLDLVHQFEADETLNATYGKSVEGFKKWITATTPPGPAGETVHWEGKQEGRSAESVIASHIVHMNRFGKNYFRSAIHGSDFVSQEDVIYLIVLRFSDPITKMDLIKKNVHEKPVGMQIINRLIARGWVRQTDSPDDRRSKLINITEKGIQALDNLMVKVRQATQIVSGNLTPPEKTELLRLLSKLHDFHQPIYDRQIDTEHLLEAALHPQLP